LPRREFREIERIFGEALPISESSEKEEMRKGTESRVEGQESRVARGCYILNRVLSALPQLTGRPLGKREGKPQKKKKETISSGRLLPYLDPLLV